MGLSGMQAELKMKTGVHPRSEEMLDIDQCVPRSRIAIELAIRDFS